jgi:hypothetical protein
MSLLTPRLPKGYHAQPAFHHQAGEIGFDFYRAYTPKREIDPLRSFWMVTYEPDARGPMPPRTRWIGFAEWARAQHKTAADYHVFANPQTPLADVRRWVEASTGADLEEVQEI